MPGGHGHRNMFYATGLPGWMRFGYSPGWGGIPPGAQYLMQSGQMPQFQSWMTGQAPYSQGQMPTTSPTGQPPMGQSPMMGTPQAGGPQAGGTGELQMLENQAKTLEGQLEQIRKRMEELEAE